MTAGAPAAYRAGVSRRNAPPWATGPPWAGPPWAADTHAQRWSGHGRHGPNSKVAAVVGSVFIAAVQVVGTVVAGSEPVAGGRSLDVWGLLLLVAGPLALVARAR